MSFIQQTAYAWPRIADIAPTKLICTLTIQRDSHPVFARQSEYSVLRIDAGTAKRLSLGSNHVIEIGGKFPRCDFQFMRHCTSFFIH